MEEGILDIKSIRKIIVDYNTRAKNKGTQIARFILLNPSLFNKLNPLELIKDAGGNYYLDNVRIYEDIHTSLNIVYTGYFEKNPKSKHDTFQTYTTYLEDQFGTVIIH